MSLLRLAPACLLIALVSEPRARLTSRGVRAAPTSDSARVPALWSACLASRAGAQSSHSASPSAEWLESEQRAWPVYDLAGFYLPTDAVPETISISRVGLPDSLGGDAFRIRTRFKIGAPAGSPNVWMTTVYSRR